MFIRTSGLAICVAVVVAASCTIDPPISPPPGPCPLPSKVLEGNEILAAGGTSAFDGVRLLRIPPHRNPEVYVDGRRSGGVRTLQVVDYTVVREMYYLSPSSPASCPGSGQPDGVIVVRTRAGR